MKTLAVITKVENGFTFYNEICRKDGHVMISDYMETNRFNDACSIDKAFGFELVCKHETTSTGDFVIVPAAVKNVLNKLSYMVDSKTRYGTINEVRKDMNLKWTDLPSNRQSQMITLSRRLVENFSLKF